MNPRAGDTVTSTKSKIATNPTTYTTTIMTTGEQQQKQQRLANQRYGNSSAGPSARKRGHADDAVINCSSGRYPEVSNAPPSKARRRVNEASNVSSTTLNGTPSRSRLGDFFSSLASKIRGPRHPELTDNRLETSSQRLVKSANNVTQLSAKREGTITDTEDSNKRPKLESDDQVRKTQSVVIVESVPDCSEPSKSANDDTDALTEEDSTNGEPQTIHFTPEEESKMIELCKSIVTDMSENIRYADDDDDEEEPGPSKQELQRPLASVLEAEHRRGDSRSPRRNDSDRLRKTIQWLEEGGRRLREDLATVRSQLHEERRASKLTKRHFEVALKEARQAEAARYQGIVTELKARLSQSPTRAEVPSTSSKNSLLKDENHRREVAALKKRLAEAESTIHRLRTNSLDRGSNKKTEKVKVGSAELRKLELEVQSLRAANKELEEKLHIAEESARTRAAELRAQHESHEADLAALQKALRSDTIKMMDEIQSKSREIEKLEKMVSESAQLNRKLRDKEDETMRKLRESERSHQIRSASRIEEKIHHDDHEVDLCKVECEDDEEATATELDRLRELATEQQGVIEVLRQAVKEKERKLEQLSNKRRKEEFYKQWLELEPVAEVDDEDEQQHEEGDSALSSAPSSLSPQPGAGRQNGVTREAYESLLLEIEELQTKLMEEQQELGHARCQVRELERALLQETRGSQNSRRALSEKLRDAEEREAGLLAEISELREQNELLEFRVLELEESPNPRDTPDPADSGIVSPEPIHLYKDHHQSNKHRDRAVATVIPYNSTYNHPLLPTDPQKAPLSLQESGIFEEDDEESLVADNPDRLISEKKELSSQGSQTETPAGELLQEVQRLQELQARIQERGAKIPSLSPVSDRKSEPSCDALEALAPLREQIRELEARLSEYEAERRIIKEREDELLDENYRLTERTFLLEADMRKLQEKINAVKLTSDAETMTVASQQLETGVQTEVDETDSKEEISRCQELYKTAVQSLAGTSEKNFELAAKEQLQPCADCSELWKDCDARIRSLGRTEFCLRQQIVSLEQRESAFFETLRQADATWAKLEADYEEKQRTMTERLDAQVELNGALFEHLTSLNKTLEQKSAKTLDEPMEVDDEKRNLIAKTTQTDEFEECRCTKSLSRSSSLATGVIVRTDSSRTSTISRTSIKMTGCDELDTIASIDPPAEVATEAKEEDGAIKKLAPAALVDEERRQPEALVSIDESSGDKKQVIYFRWR